MTFRVGHRVVVRSRNGYDWPTVSEVFGPMAGHYGHVTAVHEGLQKYLPIIDVRIEGRIDGQPISRGVADHDDDDDRCWPFAGVELEHAD